MQKNYRVVALSNKEPASRDVLWLDSSDAKDVVIKIYYNGDWVPLYRTILDASMKYIEIKQISDINYEKI